jgi:poly(hydroxyalkanoate) granule-associated protein
MASKTNTGEADARADSTADSTTDALRDSAEKIWLAGLGAFERMKSEGPRMFETLVEQGRNMSARAKDAADQALKGMRETNYEGSGRWEKFEQAIQERVSKSLSGLGVMTSKEVEALSKQVAELNEHVRDLMAASARGAAGPRGGPRKASKQARSSTRARKSARGAATATKKKAAAKRGARTSRSRQS